MAIDTSNISFINYLWTKKNSDGTLTGIRLSKDNLPEYLADPIPILAGKNISITTTNAGIEISAAADGKVKTVNTIGPDANGNVTIPIPTAGTTASAVGTKALGGNATTWSKSDHVHNISLATGDANGQVKIAGTNVSVKGLGSAAYTASTAYATSGHTHSFSQITSRGEAFLDWGGKNFSGSYGPIDAAMVPELGANRLAFMPANAVTIEYSRDGGSTWTDYGPTDSQKINLFNGLGSSFTIGKATSGAGNIATNKYQLRVNIYTSTGHVYTVLNKFVIYLSTSGTNNNWCTIRARKQSDYTAGNDKWTTFADKISVSGWSGYNVINTSGITTYGNTASTQYGHIQFIFGCDTGSTNNSYAGLNINKIFGFGGVGWTTPSTMAKTGHMYTYDSSQNVTFPKGVSAASFTEGGTSLANKYLGKTAKAADADKLDGKDSTYYLNYNNLTNKPTIPAAANNGTITIKQTGISDQTFTVNQSGNTTITLVDTNTWRPLGTGASDACAGNDARLSNARTPTAHTHISTDITDSLALIQGNNIILTQTAGGLEISAAADGKVKTVNNQQPDSNGNVTVPIPTTGVGLVRSGSAGTYTYKAKLRSETALTVNSAAETTLGKIYPIAVDKSGYLSLNVPLAGFADILKGITGRTKIEWNALNKGEYGSNSTYNGTTLPPIILENNSGFWNSASGKPLDISFHFAKKEKITTLQVKCPPYSGVNSIMSVYYAQEGDTGLTLYKEIATISTADSKIYEFNKEGISADYWVIRFTSSGWIDLRLCSPGGLFTTGLYTKECHQQIMNRFGGYQPIGNYALKSEIPTKSSWNYDDTYVKYSATQSLTDAQKAQARTNIGAGTSNFTGYTSSNKLHTDYINNVAGWTSNKGTVTSVRVQAGTGLSSSQNTTQTNTLNTTISIASGYKLPTTTEWADIPSISDAYSISAGNGIILTQTAGGLEISTASHQDISGVTGVKGNSETSYRTGNVNITKSNIGLSEVRNVSSYSKTETDNLLAQKMDKSNSNSVTIGLTQSLDSHYGTSQSITHTANQEVVFDGFSNESRELENGINNVSLKRTSNTNTNVYIQMFSSGGGFIDDGVVIYYHIVTYNS